MGAAKNLVLGGSGTIGTALCRHLLDRGEEVINLDLKNGCDLRTANLDEYAGVDYVWFLAWEVGGAKYLANPNHQFSILAANTDLCSNVFSFLERTKIPFLFSSSQLASPETAYGITKLLGEQYTRTLGGVVVRFWNVYGWEDPGEKSHVMTDIVLQGLTNKSIRLMTNGLEERQFIYIEDCVRNLCEIRKLGMPGPVHLTNGNWMRILDLARLVASECHAEITPGTETGYQHKIDPDPSYRRFQWDVSLEEGIRKVIRQAETYLLQNTHDTKTP